MSTNAGALPDAGRDRDGVYVSSEATVLTAFADRGANYTVDGYAGRMRKSLGLIYLGLDDGSAYRAQSTAVNDAISAISDRAAFALAFDVTRDKIQADPGIKFSALSNHVLAGIAMAWFELPDGRFMEIGGVTPWGTPRCPGDFAPTSAFVFLPKPGILIRTLGPSCGSRLHDAALSFVRSRRENPPQASLAKVIFETMPDDDLAASTLIGVMMGFLPTVEGNVGQAMKSWKGEPFQQLTAQYRASTISDPFDRATDVLLGPLTRAMRANPTPVKAWRTATKVHYVGESAFVEVRPDDVVTMRIGEATSSGGGSDLFPIFGGDRSQTSHPTHACPGYHAAIGVMLGMIAGQMA